MATFWERVTQSGDGVPEPLDLDYFETALWLYASGVMQLSIFDANELALTAPQQQELVALLALMPSDPGELAIWIGKVFVVFRMGRLQIAGLETIPQVLTALGLEP